MSPSSDDGTRSPDPAGDTKSATVILSSFNQPNCLKLVLEGFDVQTDRDFDLIVADDGSDEDTHALLEEFGRRAAFPMTVVTQEHTAFRKSRILNVAASRSGGDQIIFCDGDCIPFPDFVAVHRASHRPGRYATGGYIFLTAEEARSLAPDDVRTGRHRRFLEGPRGKRLRWIHRKNLFYSLARVKDKPKILGGNFSVDRKAFYDVNGFDEEFEGVGGEDSDIRNRLNRAGFRGISVWNRAFVCHLDHGLDPRRTAQNVVRGKRDKEQIRANRRNVRIDAGVSRHT